MRIIMSKKMYDRLLEGTRPHLRRAAKLRGAGLAYIKHGRAAFQVRLGRMVIEREMTVVNIEDDVLLCCDILCCRANVSADIILSK